MAIAKQIKIQHIEKEDMEKLLAIKESGLFELESGKVEINVNNGQIQNIVIHRTTYRRDKNVLQ